MMLSSFFRRFSFLLFLILIGNIALIGQVIPSYIINNVTANKGDTITISLEVMDFDTIAAFSISLEWDSLSLHFLNHKDPYFSDIGFSENNTSKIGASWATGIQYGKTIPDNSIMFSLEFEVIGDANTSTEIKTGNSPIDAFFVKSDVDFTEMTPAMISAMVNILPNSTTPTYNLNQENFILYQNQPNPFSTQTHIYFDLFETDNVKMDVFNTTGKKILSIHKEFPKGKNNFAIDKGSLSGTGMYYYTLTTSKNRQSKRLIVF